MLSTAPESLTADAKREELGLVLQSPLFSRSPSLAHLLSYLCDKALAGESDRIKEYSVALDVFGRSASFDQDADSIVRVQANRLRKRLADYYREEGAAHSIRITIPVGQYIPVFQEQPSDLGVPDFPATAPQTSILEPLRDRPKPALRRLLWIAPGAIGLSILLFSFHEWHISANRITNATSPAQQTSTEPATGLPQLGEVRIVAGLNHTYVDRSGKIWSPDSYFTGGTAERSPVRHIWRTLDPTIYRSSRQGDFRYDIPLKPAIYELHLHFAENFYGPEETGDGGEGSRVMNVLLNGRPLLTDFDVIADCGEARTADVKVFTDVVPASDGLLHLGFSSAAGGKAMISAIELFPGVRGRMRPLRIVARDEPYYSNDSHWWSSDVYFKGGQLAAGEHPALGTDDPELYETERWGHFSYAIPVTPGKYALTLHFIDRTLQTTNHDGGSELPASNLQPRTFDIFCNRKTIVHDLNIIKQAGENRPLVRKITGLEPNAQGKLLLEFEPLAGYATITAIEVLPQ